MDKLKPCPFCGSKKVKPRTDDEGISWYMFCCVCGVMCGYALSKDDAIKAWNERVPSAQPKPQWIPIFKAKDADSDQWVTGFYFAYPETTYCFTEDYERDPVKIIHCIAFHMMTDWCLPNRPTVCNIDIGTLELVGWVDSKRKTFGNEPWILPEPWRGEEHGQSRE